MRAEEFPDFYFKEEGLNKINQIAICAECSQTKQRVATLLCKDNDMTFELVSLSVDIEYRGKGLGKLLIMIAVGLAQKIGKPIELLDNSSATPEFLYELRDGEYIPSKGNNEELVHRILNYFSSVAQKRNIYRGIGFHQPFGYSSQMILQTPNILSYRSVLRSDSTDSVPQSSEMPVATKKRRHSIA